MALEEMESKGPSYISPKNSNNDTTEDSNIGALEEKNMTDSPPKKLQGAKDTPTDINVSLPMINELETEKHCDIKIRSQIGNNAINSTEKEPRRFRSSSLLKLYVPRRNPNNDN